MMCFKLPIKNGCAPKKRILFILRCLRLTAFDAITFHLQNESRRWSVKFVARAYSIERSNKHINFSGREFKMARELDRVSGIDNADTR
jgi:hypothetical protein